MNIVLNGFRSKQELRTRSSIYRISHCQQYRDRTGQFSTTSSPFLAGVIPFCCMDFLVAVNQWMGNVQRSTSLLNKYHVQFHCCCIETEFWVKSSFAESSVNKWKRISVMFKNMFSVVSEFKNKLFEWCFQVLKFLIPVFFFLL